MADAIEMNAPILFASPNRFVGDNAFYVKRDAFRFVEFFQSVGISTKLVLLSSETGGETPGDERLVAEPFERWIDPDFWKAFNVRTVIVYSFGVLRPRQMPPVFRAIRGAGCRVVFQMDTAFGLVRFPDWCWTMSKRRYWWARGWGRRRSVIHSLARATAQTAYWAWGGTFRFMCRDLLPLCDSIRVESEMALENTRKRLRSLHQAEMAERVVLATHPVPDAYAWDHARIVKNNRIVCAALDWRNPRKGGRELAKALARVLPGSGWDAVVVGKHADLPSWLLSTGSLGSFSRRPVRRKRQTSCRRRSSPAAPSSFHPSWSIWIRLSGQTRGRCLDTVPAARSRRRSATRWMPGNPEPGILMTSSAGSVIRRSCRC